MPLWPWATRVLWLRTQPLCVTGLFPRCGMQTTSPTFGPPRPAGFNRLLARMEEEFSGFTHRSVHVDSLTSAFVEARLVMEGYSPHSLLAMVLEGELAKPAPLCDIRPVDTSEGWQDYETLFRADAQGWLERPGGEHAFPVADALLEIRRLKERAGVRFWIAYVEGRPASYLCNASNAQRRGPGRRPVHPSGLPASRPGHGAPGALCGGLPRCGRTGGLSLGGPGRHSQVLVPVTGLSAAGYHS